MAALVVPRTGWMGWMVIACENTINQSIKLVVEKKLDGVGPVDNRPSTD